MTNDEKALEARKQALLKQIELDDEWFKRVIHGDKEVEYFMNTNNGKNIDLKIKVLKALNAGKKPNEIEGYDKVVLVPTDRQWD